MNYYKVIIVIVSCLLMFASCKKNARTKGSLKSYVLPEVTQDTIMIDSLIKKHTLKFIPLQTTDQSLLGDATEVFKTDSAYVIYDRQLNKILSFDSNGNFLSQTGREGKGANEYVGRLYFNFNTYSNTVDVIDYRDKLIKYKPLTDTVIQENDLKFDDFDVDYFYPSGKDSYFLYNNVSMGLKGDTLYRFAYLKDDVFLYKSLPYPNINVEARAFFNEFMFYNYNGDTYFFENFNSKNSLVYKVDENGIHPDYRIFYESLEDTYDDLTCCLPAILKGEDLGHVIRLDKVLENKRYLFLYYGESYKADTKIFFSRFAIYDKSKNNCIINSASPFMLEELALSLYMHQVADDTFLSFVPAYIIIDRQELISKFINPEDYTELMKEFMKIDVDEMDNLVMLSLQMKDL